MHHTILQKFDFDFDFRLEFDFDFELGFCGLFVRFYNAPDITLATATSQSVSQLLRLQLVVASCC